MAWSPNDLVTDADLQDYENDILSNFGQTSWQSKRTKALEDWLFPILRANGYDPFRLRTRMDVHQAFTYISSAYTDVTSATTDETEDDLNLASTFATVGTDALYLGSLQPFKGIFVRMADSVSAVASVLTVAYWNGVWETLQITDGTSKTAGKVFSGGGTIGWILPVDWAVRTVNSSDDRQYWVKLTVSATPTSAKAGQIGLIRSSVLRAPIVFRTLELIFREAPTRGDGPWREKAEYYATQADAALQRALTVAGGEFDTDDSDQIGETEADQSIEAAGHTGFRLLRG